MTIGERIKDARKQAGYRTQVALAKDLGCKRETVTMWETDKVEAIGGDYLPKLSRLLRRSPEWIQKGKEAAPKRLTQPGSKALASPELLRIRHEGDIDALTVIVNAFALAVARSIPAAGWELKEALANLPDAESGRYAEILTVLNEALETSEAERQVAQPRGASSRGGKNAK